MSVRSAAPSTWSQCGQAASVASMVLSGCSLRAQATRARLAEAFLGGIRQVRLQPLEGGRLELSGVFGGLASLASSSPMRAVGAPICCACASICVCCARIRAILITGEGERGLSGSRHSVSHFGVTVSSGNLLGVSNYLPRRCGGRPRDRSIPGVAILRPARVGRRRACSELGKAIQLSNSQNTRDYTEKQIKPQITQGNRTWNFLDSQTESGAPISCHQGPIRAHGGWVLVRIWHHGPSNWPHVTPIGGQKFQMRLP